MSESWGEFLLIPIKFPENSVREYRSGRRDMRASLMVWCGSRV
jgi:hypothetical protein